MNIETNKKQAMASKCGNASIACYYCRHGSCAWNGECSKKIA